MATKTKKSKLTPLPALEQAAECLKTLAHPHRLRIVQMLLQGRYTVGELAEADAGGSWVRGEGNTRSRLASITARTLNNDMGIELPDLKSALCARDDPENPVCRDLSVDGSSGTNDSANPIAFTAGSMIYEYGEKFLLHLAAGPPSRSEFQVFEFTR